MGIFVPFAIICCVFIIFCCKYQAFKEQQKRQAVSSNNTNNNNNISFIDTSQDYVSRSYFNSNQVYPQYNNQNRGYDPDSFIQPPPSYDNVVKNEHFLKK